MRIRTHIKAGPTPELESKELELDEHGYALSGMDWSVELEDL